MAAFSIRNVPNKVHAWLRVRAAKKGRSMEAEARAILTEACLDDEARMSGSELQEWVDSLYGSGKPGDVVEELIAERRREGAGE